MRCLRSCRDLGPLCHPNFICSRCGLDFDDETFFHKRSARGRMRGFDHAIRSRVHDTICKACRDEERGIEKGPTPTTDWSKIDYGRFLEASRRTMVSHAKRFGTSVHEFEKAGWGDHALATKMKTTPQCEYCERPFASMADQTVDIVVPSRGYSFMHNVKIACNTCQNGKRPFEDKPNALELIDRWMYNWRRWLDHKAKCLTRLPLPLGTDTPPAVSWAENGQGSFDRLLGPRSPAKTSPAKSGPPPSVAARWCTRCGRELTTQQINCPRCGLPDDGGC
jgi:hypothetical protein